jgi:hypothetical protein
VEDRRVRQAALCLPGPVGRRVETLEELEARLKELESARTSAEREFVALKDRRRRVEELQEDRDALLESLAGMLPEALDDLTGEERCRIYQMLRLEVMPVPQGGTRLAARYVLLQPHQDEVEAELELGVVVGFFEEGRHLGDAGEIVFEEAADTGPVLLGL